MSSVRMNVTTDAIAAITPASFAALILPIPSLSSSPSLPSSFSSLLRRIARTAPIAVSTAAIRFRSAQFPDGAARGAAVSSIATASAVRPSNSTSAFCSAYLFQYRLFRVCVICWLDFSFYSVIFTVILLSFVRFRSLCKVSCLLIEL